MIGVTLLIVSVLVILIWIFLEVKRLKHRLWAIFFIALILFLYFTGAFVFRGENVDFKSVSGIFNAGKIYFSWLFSVSGNFKSITTHAVEMDWQGNKTIG